MTTNAELLIRLRKLHQATERKNPAFADTLTRVIEALLHCGHPDSSMPIQKLLDLSNAKKALATCVRRLAAGDKLDDVLQRDVPANTTRRRPNVSQQVLEEFVSARDAPAGTLQGRSTDDGGGSWDNAVKLREDE